MILRSIKWRLQLWHGLILVLVLGGFGYTAFELQRTREIRRVDQELSDRGELLFGPPRRPGRGPGFRGPISSRDFEADQNRSIIRRREREPGETESPDRPPGPEGPPRGFPPFAEERELAAAFPEDGPFFYAYWDRNGRLVRSGAVPVGLTLRRQSRSGLFQTDGYRELHRVLPRGDSIVIGRSMKAELQEMRNLALLLGFSGCGILALGLAGGWIVATRAMQPIEKISSTAQKIATGDLSQRIVHEENESELGRLVAILNSTFARLEGAFSEQARFTTDVSHELRTPVTVIVSQTQMALLRDR